MLPVYLRRHAEFRNRKVVVTGACGFLGNSVCELLKELGATVIRIDPRLASEPFTSRSDFDLPLGIQDSELRGFLSDVEFDLIFHLAGAAFAAQSVLEPFFDFEANLRATIQFLETLRAIHFHGLLVYASSAAVYGEPARLPITEDTPPNPISPYGVSKYASENYLKVYGDLFDFRVILARLFSLFGPGQRKQVVFDIVSKALASGDTIELLGDGSEMRDLIYGEDAAAALVLLSTLPPAAIRTINICSGRAITVRTLAEKISGLITPDSRRICFTGVRRPGDPLIWAVSNELLLSTGFRAGTDLEEGILKTIQWCQEESRLESLEK